ncbi:unnamed protein product [Litomosoides sigmodontis]|uniref:Uncharacterized protein n=1 Tax=Litomosoides sigmodontis TaxID=42156 RepID=A0A3P7K1I2_LITSI|nr:unnamed protein product [Litomosoides sigmodontis]
MHRKILLEMKKHKKKEPYRSMSADFDFKRDKKEEDISVCLQEGMNMNEPLATRGIPIPQHSSPTVHVQPTSNSSKDGTVLRREVVIYDARDPRHLRQLTNVSVLNKTKM